MFYLLVLKKDLDVTPRYFGKQLKDHIIEKLIAEVEGTCHAKYGYVVAMLKMQSCGVGKIRSDGTGYATFTVQYQAIVCRPYKGEVVDAVVTSVNKMGFFADAGPLNIFVSNHLIPEDWEFNAIGDPCYQSPEADARIMEGCEVRVRIMGTKIDQQDIFCIGSIKDDYLGLVAGPV